MLNIFSVLKNNISCNNRSNNSHWQRFKNNKSALYALWLFIAIFSVSLCANIIANDKPLLVSYKNNLYVPVLYDYPETTFSGIFETSTEYKDPSVQQLILQNGYILWPAIPFADQSVSYTRTNFPAPPNHENWLGTDDQGRDVLARILYGMRISIVFGLCVTLVSALIGMAVGSIQGFYGGFTDLIGQRLVEVWSGLPFLFMVIVLVSILEPNLFWLFVIMVMFGWVPFVSTVRAEFLRARKAGYVVSAQVLGVSSARIIQKHILPNVLATTLSQLPFVLGANIIALTSLDYLGYGLPPGSASLGNIILQSKNNLDAPWLAISAFVSLTVLLSLLMFIGEGLRDAFDVKK